MWLHAEVVYRMQVVKCLPVCDVLDTMSPRLTSHVLPLSIVVRRTCASFMASLS